MLLEVVDVSAYVVSTVDPSDSSLSMGVGSMVSEISFSLAVKVAPSLDVASVRLH